MKRSSVGLPNRNAMLSNSALLFRMSDGSGQFYIATRLREGSWDLREAAVVKSGGGTVAVTPGSAVVMRADLWSLASAVSAVGGIYCASGNSPDYMRCVGE